MMATTSKANFETASENISNKINKLVSTVDSDDYDKSSISIVKNVEEENANNMDIVQPKIKKEPIIAKTYMEIFYDFIIKYKFWLIVILIIIMFLLIIVTCLTSTNLEKNPVDMHETQVGNTITSSPIPMYVNFSPTS